MPRVGRTVLPYYPHHVIQRGHNRQVVFAEPGDYQRYLDTLAEFKDVYGVRVYAWCLMTNHVHLLLAPDTIAGLGQLMKRLAGRQTRYHKKPRGHETKGSARNQGVSETKGSETKGSGLG